MFCSNGGDTRCTRDHLQILDHHSSGSVAPFSTILASSKVGDDEREREREGEGFHKFSLRGSSQDRVRPLVACGTSIVGRRTYILAIIE